MPRAIDFPWVIGKLKDFYFRRHRLPSFAEMQTLFGYRSKGGVSVLIPRLLEKGILQKDPHGKLIPSPFLKGGLRVLGSIQAGIPSPAEEENLDVVSLEGFLISKPEATFIVRVSGDSMIEAGIMPGDMILVERGRSAKPGDIVVAQVDGEWTLKYFRKKNGKAFLEAANPKYGPIHPKKELMIGGIVIANVRKYL